MASLRFPDATRQRSLLRFLGRSLTILGAITLLTGASVAGPPAKPAPPGPAPRLSVVIEGRGTIIVELDTKAAPKSCAHIVALANKQFYDGMLFHLVVGGFVAKTGDPGTKKLTGAKISNLSAEEIASKYGVGNGGSPLGNVPLEPGGVHERGTLGMWRNGPVDSNDSQFFFNMGANHSLDYLYTEFGKVVSGIEALPKPKPGEKQDTTMTLTRGLKVMDSIKQGDKIVSIRVVTVERPAPPKK